MIIKPLVHRIIFAETSDHLLQKEITVIVGARQTGKTTLLGQLKDWLIKEKRISQAQIVSFNLDLIDQLNSLRNQADFIKYLNEELKKVEFLFVFIDEIQRLENPGFFLKGVYDLDLPVKLIVTGSSALEIKAKIFESLTGRKRVFQLWPFSFSEYLSRHEPTLISLLGKKNVSSINKNKLLDQFYDFSVFGGYPGMTPTGHRDEKIQTLKEIYSSYIEKDIINLLKIKNPFTFTKLLSLLADQAGNLVNVNEISNTLGINVRTVENYLHALENTFIIALVRPYFTNVRKELTKMPKIYFIDAGLRNMAVKNFTDFRDNRDKGQLLETFVFSQIVKNYPGQINFWRTKDKSEVDFILRDYYGNMIPMEAKAMALNEPSIPRGLRAFIDRYKPQKAFVVNLALEADVALDQTSVRFILPFQVDRIFT